MINGHGTGCSVTADTNRHYRDMDRREREYKRIFNSLDSRDFIDEAFASDVVDDALSDLIPQMKRLAVLAAYTDVDKYPSLYSEPQLELDGADFRVALETAVASVIERLKHEHTMETITP